MKKPNLKLTAKDFQGFVKRGAENLTQKEDLAIANDLKTLLQFMIENEDEMNIDFDDYEQKMDCGTYRCVAGWWCVYLGKRISQLGRRTVFFKSVFDGVCFSDLMGKFFKKHGFHWMDFFGVAVYGDLKYRLGKTNELIKDIK